MGKSGIIARKIAATLSSTGTPALFMHPVDAVHGDLGMVVRGDVVLALSASGETEEILRLLATIKRLQVPLISMTGDAVFGRKTRARRPRPHEPCRPQRRSRLWRRRLTSLLTAPWRRRPAVWGWRRPLPPPPCWLWATRWLWRFRKSAAFKEEDFANLHPGGKAGQAPGAGRVPDAFGRRCAAGHAANQNAGRDLRNVAQEAGRDRGG